ncbi:MAG: hypothetical protein GC139_02145 [Sideroxydans sp.]|nr:hypothetical protein [Sideroxydans sp.]
MERESLLMILLLLLGGLVIQPFALIPSHDGLGRSDCNVERRAWLRLWLPIMPALLVAAWLCGWALHEPDPVDDPLGRWELIGACFPFGVVMVRAVLRAIWALFREPDDAGVCTVGLFRPRILFSPFLARKLDEGMLHAAWQHEHAHARHRDPLRIWLAQFATDLQWPWPWARKRFDAWLEALECARDDEARRHGVRGADLAAAVLAMVRQSPVSSIDAARRTAGVHTHALLVGDRQALQKRIARLLSPLPELQATSDQRLAGFSGIESWLAGLLAVACVLGILYGEPVMHSLLAWTS